MILRKDFRLPTESLSRLNIANPHRDMLARALCGKRPLFFLLSRSRENSKCRGFPYAFELRNACTTAFQGFQVPQYTVTLCPDTLQGQVLPGWTSSQKSLTGCSLDYLCKPEMPRSYPSAVIVLLTYYLMPAVSDTSQCWIHS